MIAVWSDSTCMGQAQLLGQRLGQIIHDGAVGGDTIGQVAVRFFDSAGGPGQSCIFRAGHNVDLRQGKVDYIDTQMRQMVAAAGVAVVCELSLMDDVAYDRVSGSQNMKVWRNELNDRWASRPEFHFFAAQDRMIAYALARNSDPNDTYELTFRELEDCKRDLVPERYRDMRIGVNDGHYSPLGKALFADLLVPFLREVPGFISGVVTPPPVDPTPTPTPKPKPWWKQLLGL